MSNPLIEVKTDTSQVLRELRKRTRQVIRDIQRVMLSSMGEYRKTTIRSQMSGRVRDNYGLNRRTGNLARSWEVYPEGLNWDIS